MSLQAVEAPGLIFKKIPTCAHTMHLYVLYICQYQQRLFQHTVFCTTLNFRRRIKSRLPFAGIIRSLPYSTRFQDKG